MVNDELVTFHKFMPEDVETKVKPEFIPGRYRPRNGAPKGYIYKNKTVNGMPSGYYLETGATADRLIDNLVGLLKHAKCIEYLPRSYFFVPSISSGGV